MFVSTHTSNPTDKFDKSAENKGICYFFAVE